MTRKTALLLLSTLFLLLLATGSLAVGCQDGQIKRNVCDAGFTARSDGYAAALTGYYGSNIVPGADNQLRYPAALYYFSNGSDSVANALLDAQLGTGTLTPTDAVYLAWIENAYADHLSDANAATLTAALDSFTPSSQSESEYFLSLVKQGLLGDDSTLTQYLENKGANGWSSEENPAALADVVIGCAALLARSSDQTVRRLAEMNLDILFTRFASQDAAGVFGGVSVNDTNATAFLNPAATPWYGWSGLLFSTGDTSIPSAVREPALLLSRYCANPVLHSIQSGTTDQTRFLQQRFGSGLVSTASDKNVVFAGGVELDGNALASPDGYVTRAAVRSLADPLGFILFTTATSAAYAPGANADSAVTAYPLDNDVPYVLIGRLGGDTCSEPHLYLSDVSYNTSRGVTIIKLGDSYYAFRFLGGQYVAPMDARYKPLSRYTLNGGLVVFPANGLYDGIFSFEEVPLTVVNYVKSLPSPSTNPLYNIAQYVAGQTALSFNGGAIEYQSKINDGTQTIYSYMPGQTLTVNQNAVAPNSDDFPFRGVKEGGVNLVSGGDTWTVSDGTNSFTLNFPDAIKTATADIYDCPGVTPDNGGGSGTGSSGTQTLAPGDRLAFLAGSTRNDMSDYSLACSDQADEVLPNPLQTDGTQDDYIQGACALTSGDTRVIGILYDNGPNSDIHPLFAAMNNYAPFTGLALDENFCDDALDLLPPNQYDFISCPTINEGATDYYVFVSLDAGAVIFKSEQTPLGGGLFGRIWSWFNGLFGTPDQPTPDLSDLHGFERGYFYHAGERSIVAQEGDNQAELDYDNLSFSVEPLAALFGQYASYAADTYTQAITATNPSIAAWRAATSGLRPNLSGQPHDFGTRCAVSGTACATKQPGTSLKRCDDGVHDITCNEDCTLNYTQCNATYYYDNDGDGYGNATHNQTAEKADEHWVMNNLDCDDNNPLLPNPSDPNSCTLSGTPPKNYTCDQSLDGCSAVCKVSLPPPEPSLGDCPTEWTVALHLGEYTFSTRINEDGKPEVMVHASAEKINGHTHRCNWGVTPNGKAKHDKTIVWSGTEGEKTRIFNFVTTDSHARVKLIESGMGWKIQFNTNVPNGWASDCWGVEDVSDYPAVIGNVLPEAQDVCLQYLCIIDDPACTHEVYTGGGTSCESTDDCYGNPCLDGDCVLPDCQSDSDCEEGVQCVNGVCENSSTGGGCFDPATPILFADGSSHPLGEVKVGDRVLGATVPGENTVDTVVEVFAHEGDFSLLRVNGDLLVTPIHRVLTGRGWLSVANLVVGDTLVAPDGSPVPVTSIVPAGSAPAVYNLETVPTHTYYAGGVLVHNVKDAG